MGSSLSFFMITFFFSSLHLPPFFLSKKPCVWSLFSPSNLSWGSKNTTLSRNYLWEKLLTTCAHNVGKSFLNSHFCFYSSKVEKVSNCSLDSPSVQIQIMSGKVCLRCKVKTMLGVVYKLLKTKSLFTSPSNVLPYYLKKTFPLIIWILTEGEGDGIESRLAS